MPQSNSRDVGEIYEEDRPCEECGGHGMVEDDDDDEDDFLDMEELLDEVFKKIFGNNF